MRTAGNPKQPFVVMREEYMRLPKPVEPAVAAQAMKTAPACSCVPDETQHGFDRFFPEASASREFHRKRGHEDTTRNESPRDPQSDVPDAVHERRDAALARLVGGPDRFCAGASILGCGAEATGVSASALWSTGRNRRCCFHCACSDQAALHLRPDAAGERDTSPHRSRLFRVPERVARK